MKFKKSIFIGGMMLVFPFLVSLDTKAAELSEEQIAILSKHPVKENRYSVEPNIYPSSSAVWRVENLKTRKHFFLGGTSHVLKKADFPLPSAYYAVYHESDVLVLESTDDTGVLDEKKLMQWVFKFYSSLLYEEGETLEDDISKDTARLLKDKLGDRYEDVIKVKPLMISLEILMEDLDEFGGVEDIFKVLSERDSKKVGVLDDEGIDKLALEALEEMKNSMEPQIAMEGIDAVVLEILTENEKAHLSKAVRKGNLKEMEKEFLSEIEFVEDENLLHRLLPERNKKWIKRMVPMLNEESPEVEYILVGAYHLFGKSGLIELLKKEGYKVDQLYGIDRP